MNNSKKLALAAGFLAAFHGASAFADELYVLGPVERFSERLVCDRSWANVCPS